MPSLTMKKQFFLGGGILFWWTFQLPWDVFFVHLTFFSYSKGDFCTWFEVT